LLQTNTSFSLIGKIKPNIINHFSQEDLFRRDALQLELELNENKLKLTVSLNKILQLLFCWTRLGYAIQTLISILIFSRVYNLLSNLSWHATQCNFSILRLVKLYKTLWKINRQENDYNLEEYKYEQQNQQFDVTAGLCLNEVKSTGARSFINEFVKIMISICVVTYQIKLTEHLIQHVQLKTGWTILVLAIQTLSLKCLFVFNQFLDASWLGTQSNSKSLLYRSRHSKALKPTSQPAETCLDLITPKANYLSQSYIDSSQYSRIQRGGYHVCPLQLKPLAMTTTTHFTPWVKYRHRHTTPAPNF
jgi:hypothetical protein